MHYLGPEDEILHQRYARTLMALAQECGRLDKIAEDLEAFSRAVEENRLFAKVFSHPAIAQEEKIKLLEAFSKKARFSREFIYFLKLLAENKRLNIIHGILLKYRDLYDRHKRRQKIVVQTAARLTAKETRRLKAILAKALNKNVYIEQVVDPFVVAGFNLKVANRTYNLSLNNRLKFAEERLAGQ